MKSDTFVIASHVYYSDGIHDVHGPAHTIYDYLMKKKLPVVFIKHCIENHYPSVVLSGSKREAYEIPRSFAGAFVRKFMISMRVLPATPTTFIGVDPFNGLVGLVAKMKGRVERFIYYTPDYTDRRYKNPLLNAFYYMIDRIDLRFADEAWSVSSRIRDLRARQGIADRKNKLVPNTPDVSSVPHYPYDGNKTLILVSNLTTAHFIQPILSAVAQLRRTCPDVRLVIFGGRDTATVTRLVRKLGLDSVVHVLGQRSHREVLERIARSFLGLALYTGASRGTYWGDSMKAREYVACGIPVVINELPSTSEDIKAHRAGIVLKNVTETAVFDAVKGCIEDQVYYRKLRRAALLLGKKFDKGVLLGNLLLSSPPLEKSR